MYNAAVSPAIREEGWGAKGLIGLVIGTGNGGNCGGAQAGAVARARGHIAIYHSPAYFFIIAMPLQPSFRLAPESRLAGSITVVGGYDAGFRLAPE